MVSVEVPMEYLQHLILRQIGVLRVQRLILIQLDQVEHIIGDVTEVVEEVMRVVVRVKHLLSIVVI